MDIPTRQFAIFDVDHTYDLNSDYEHNFTNKRKRSDSFANHLLQIHSTVRTNNIQRRWTNDSLFSILIPYRTKFRRTKFSTDKIFRLTKFSTPSVNFDSFVRFLTTFCIEILDKIFDGKNVSLDKIFDTKLKFRHFCPTNFCPIR